MSVQENRSKWIAMLKDPKNQHRKTTSGLLGEGDRCCAMGLWVRAMHPEIIEELNTCDDRYYEEEIIEDAYLAVYEDLDIPNPGYIWQMNDNSNLTFAQIAEKIETELFV